MLRMPDSLGGKSLWTINQKSMPIPAPGHRHF
jgi:hypothetical protein